MDKYIRIFEDDYYNDEESLSPEAAVELVMTGSMLRKKPKTSEERIIAYYNLLEQEGFTNSEIVDYAHKFFKYGKNWIIATLQDNNVWVYHNK